MATYYHGGSEMQENQQTLYVMNPNYSYIAAYSDTNNSNNMLLLNALSQGGFPHAPPPPPAAQPFLWSSSAPAQQLSLSLSPQQRNPAARGVLVGSKYLKAAEELLDEVVRVHRVKEKGVAAASDVAVSREAGESSQMVVHQLLSSAQRQDLHMKKAKLINMLHEVEQKYKEYQSQMQAVVSCLEQETGPGSAKSYTSLALRTISKQFRCLKEGITSQVKATNKSLGMGGDEDHHQDGVKPVGSRLSLVDHQLRQQRALHQLGMMGHNSTVWRPQRGLPERAVSVLRAWLFEHFLHPYPKDSDKHMLAKQTGLTRSQVSNWFINARVRLWKPMVEEMYSEEVKAQEHNGDKTTTTNGNTTTTAVPPANGNETTATKSPKRLRSNKNRSSSPSSILSMEIKGQGQSQGDQSGFNPVYVVSDLTRTISPDHMAGPYGSNLTLGLPTNIHEQVFMPNNNINNNELGRRVEGGADFWGISINNSSSSSHPVSDNGFHAIDIDIQTRKTFAAHQLLHDFVA